MGAWHPDALACGAATRDSFKAKAQDADRAALAGTGLEGLFDPAPTGEALCSSMAQQDIMLRARRASTLQ